MTRWVSTLSDFPAVHPVVAMLEVWPVGALCPSIFSLTHMDKHIKALIQLVRIVICIFMLHTFCFCF